MTGIRGDFHCRISVAIHVIRVAERADCRIVLRLRSDLGAPLLVIEIAEIDVIVRDSRMVVEAVRIWRVRLVRVSGIRRVCFVRAGF
ncbi:hypothetical protein GR927_12040 [Mycolicibacterium sp. 3033]|nr:hypothetical protein [Mycolicibacterium aurantiacum]